MALPAGVRRLCATAVDYKLYALCDNLVVYDEQGRACQSDVTFISSVHKHIATGIMPCTLKPNTHSCTCTCTSARSLIHWCTLVVYDEQGRACQSDVTFMSSVYKHIATGIILRPWRQTAQSCTRANTYSLTHGCAIIGGVRPRGSLDVMFVSAVHKHMATGIMSCTLKTQRSHSCTCTFTSAHSLIHCCNLVVYDEQGRALVAYEVRICRATSTWTRVLVTFYMHHPCIRAKTYSVV